MKIEAESYSNVNFAVGCRTDTPEFSNGSIMVFIGKAQEGKKLCAEYKVNSPTGGAYRVNAVTTLLSSKYTTDYYIQVNGGEMIDAALDASLISEISSKTYPDTVKKYGLGTLELEKGENTIRFILNDSDLRTDGNLAFYLDYFELIETPFGIKKINPLKTLGVFEQNQSVSFELQFNCKVPEEKTLSFEVKNVWAAKALASKFRIRKGSRSTVLNLGKFEQGWYTVEVFDGDEKMGFTTFSVVVPLSERPKLSDSPFAIDFASDWLVRGGKEKVSDYIKAARLAGNNWVRERFIWSDIEPKKGSFDFTVMDRALAPFENSGLKIINTFHDTPGWGRSSGMTLPKNLFDVYKMQKAVAERYKDTVSVWEMWNEEDTIFAAEPADLYAAFFKAAAIGVEDANVGAKSMVGGFATKGSFVDLAFQNGISDYSMGHNYHYHISYVMKNVNQYYPKTDLRQTVSSAYDRNKGSVWVTEAGMYLPVDKGRPPSRDQQLGQAKYLVTSTVQSLASGTDKHFWFILPSYVEVNRELGSFYATGNPYPCYSAEATITYLLGEGKYKGVMSNLPENAEGYLFDSGSGDVAVLWSEHGDVVNLKSDAAVTVTDFVGGAEVITPENGMVTVNISQYPVYVSFGDTCAAEDYYPQHYDGNHTKEMKLTKAKRVVLSQKFGSEAFQTPKISGYQLKADRETQMIVEVYNFNDTEVSGKVKPVAPEGCVITPSEISLKVGAMEKGEAVFTIEFTDEVEPNITSFLAFHGEFEGEETSPSVSRIYPYKEVEQDKVTVLEGSEDPEKWDGTNITGNAEPAEITVGSKAGAVRFDVKFHGGDRWFYPQFTVSDPTVFRGTTGICYYVYAEEDLIKISMNFFAYLKDGRQYYLGHSNGKQIKAGWNQIVVPWEKLSLQSSPYGLLDFRDFDTDLISKISVGCNSPYDDVAPYEIFGLGCYTEEKREADKAEIKIEGVEKDGVYSKGDIGIVNAVLPEQEYKAFYVMLNGYDYTDYEIEGCRAEFDLSGLERGGYTLQIAAETKFGYMVRKVVNFYVE